MTWGEVDKYLIPAIVNLYGKDLYIHAYDLDKKLGVTWYQDVCSKDNVLKGPDYDPLPEWGRRLYQQLAGPHGRTILKAYRIKKGLE